MGESKKMETLEVTTARNIVTMLLDRVAWHVTTAGASGGTFSIHFAEPILRRASGKGSGEITFATHEGECQLYVFSDWTADDLAAQRWDREMRQESAQLLQGIKSKKLIGIDIDQGGGLRVEFPGLRLATSAENGCLYSDVIWSVVTKEDVISLELNGALVLEKRR